MNLYEEIKEHITPEQAAKRYGLNVRRGMTSCLFHEDHTPSMKLYDDHFYCFGCHKSGDVIDLAAGIFNLSPHEAARKLSADFGATAVSDCLRFGRSEQISSCKTQQSCDERLCFLVLTDYLHLLWDWKKKYAPDTPDKPPDEHFIEACHMQNYIEYLCDIFISGSDEERKSALQKLHYTGKIHRLKEYISQRKQEEQRIERREEHKYGCAV